MEQKINYLDYLPDELLNAIITYCSGLSKSVLFLTSIRLQKMIGNNKKNKNIICESAANKGYLNILQWARDINCGWNVLTCRNAATNGHLEVLKWARKNGCKIAC